MEERTVLWKPQVAATVLLLLALFPEMPYGYYVLLRWILCPLFVYLALRALTLGIGSWVWILGVIAALYNPIFRVHLTREVWNPVNLATIAVALYSIVVLGRPNRPIKG
jgi:hypothetical protein